MHKPPWQSSVWFVGVQALLLVILCRTLLHSASSSLSTLLCCKCWAEVQQEVKKLKDTKVTGIKHLIVLL
jgi:hypothetical protein